MGHQISDAAHFVPWNLLVLLLELLGQMIGELSDLQNGHRYCIAISRAVHELLLRMGKVIMRSFYFIAVFQHMADDIAVSVNAGHIRAPPRDG